MVTSSNQVAIKEIIQYILVLSMLYALYLIGIIFIGNAFLSITILMLFTFILYLSLFKINRFSLIDGIFYFLFMDIIWASNIIVLSFFCDTFYLKMGFGLILYILAMVSLIMSTILWKWSIKNVFSYVYREFYNKRNVLVILAPILVLIFYWIMRVFSFPRYPSPDEYYYVELAKQIIYGMPPAPFYVIRGKISQLLLGRYFWIINIAIGLIFNYPYLAVDISLLMIYAIAYYLLSRLRIKSLLLRILFSALMMIIPGVYVLSFLLLPDLFLHVNAFAGIVLFGYAISKIERKSYVTNIDVISILCILLYVSIFILLIKNNLAFPLIFYLIFLGSLNKLKKQNKLAKRLLVVFIIIPILYELFIDMPIAVFRYIFGKEPPSFLYNLRIINIAGFFISLFVQTEFTKPIMEISIYDFLSEFIFVMSPNRLSLIVYSLSLVYVFLSVIKKVRIDNTIFRYLTVTFILYLLFSTLYFSLLKYPTLGWDESRNSLILDLIAYILSIGFLNTLINSKKFCTKDLALINILIGSIVTFVVISSFIKINSKLMYASSMLSIFGIKSDFKAVLLFSAILVFLFMIFLFLRYFLEINQIIKFFVSIRRIIWMIFIVFIAIHSLIVIYTYHHDNYIVLENYDIVQVKNFIERLDASIVVTNIYAVQGLNRAKAVISFPMTTDEFSQLLKINISFAIIYDDRAAPTWTNHIFGLDKVFNESLKSINWRSIRIINVTSHVRAYLLNGSTPILSSTANLVAAVFNYQSDLLAYIELKLYSYKAMRVYAIISSICCSRVYVFSCNRGLNQFVVSFPRWIKINSRYRFYGPYFQRETTLILLDEKGNIIHWGFLNTNSGDSALEMRILLLLVFLFLSLLFITIRFILLATQQLDKGT